MLSVNLSIQLANLLACMRDRASANNVAVQALKIVYPTVVDVGCFSHTIDHVGEKFNCSTLAEFVTLCSHTAPRLRCFGGLELARVWLATVKQDGGPNVKS